MKCEAIFFDFFDKAIFFEKYLIPDHATRSCPGAAVPNVEKFSLIRTQPKPMCLTLNLLFVVLLLQVYAVLIFRI
jgi:hypothetical protein